MSFHTSWRKLAGLAAVSAVLLAVTACGANDKEQGASGSSPAATSPAASTSPAAAASPAATATAKKSWSQPPAMQIDPAKSYTAEVKTSKGSFTIELFAKDAPKTVNNFVFLSKENFYNGIYFHRIIETFMIQVGDPTGTGSGGPGYKFEDELPTKYKYDQGIVAMANAGPNTNGSQFFVVTGDASHLNSQPNYTVFGKVVSGMDTVMAIAKTPVSGQRPTEKVTIDSVTITEK